MIENEIYRYVNGFLKWNISKNTSYIVGNKKFTRTISVLNLRNKRRRRKSKTRVTSSNPQVMSSNLRVSSSNPQVTSSNLRVTSSNPQAASSSPRVRRLKARVGRLKV